jgi:hypothetical protein
VFLGVNYVVWLAGVARTALLLQTRLLLAAFGGAAVLGGIALERLRLSPSRPVDVAWLGRAVVVLSTVMLFVSMLVGFVRANPLPVVLGVESQDDYRTRQLGWYYVAIEYINGQLHPGSVVLFLWEPRSYDCEIECWPDALLDRWLHTTHVNGQDAEAIADSWWEEGITHVLLYRRGYDAIVAAGFDPVTEDDRETLNDLQTHYLTLVEDFGSVYELYRLEVDS